MTNPTNKNSFNPDGTLTCRMCQRDKDSSQFHRNRAISTGFERVCKPCAREKAREWRSRNKQTRSRPSAEADAARRAKRAEAMGAAPSNLVSGWRQVLFDFYGRRCLKCKSPDNLQADHVVPVSKGGPHRAENLQPLCRFCNISKHNKTQDYRDGLIFTESVMLRLTQNPR